jgi:hypothetical protein
MAAFDLGATESGDNEDLPEDGAPAVDDAAPEADAAPTGPGAVVSLQKPESRRARAARELNERLEGMANSVKTLTEGLSQRDQQLAQMRGFMEAQAMQPRYTAPAPQQQGPDPDDLVKQAKKALTDHNDFDTYQRLTLEAAEVRAMRRMAPVVQELQQRASQGGNSMPPELGAMFAAYPDVAMHPRNVDFLQAKNLELHARGVPPGPERLRMVFAEVDAGIKGGKKGAPAQYSQASGAVLSGIPTSRGVLSGGSDGPGITLTATEAEVAARLERQGVMTKAQYAKGLADADPARVRGG